MLRWDSKSGSGVGGGAGGGTNGTGAVGRTSAVATRSAVSVADSKIETRDAEPFEAPCDLRRRFRAEQVDLVLRRATDLATPDRLLLESMLRDGYTTKRLASLSSQSVRTLRRRAKRLIQRLASPEFMFVVRHRDAWPTTRRRVADACIVEGRSMKLAARTLRLSFHSVRRQMETIAGLFEGAMPGRVWNAPAGFRRDVAKHSDAPPVRRGA